MSKFIVEEEVHHYIRGKCKIVEYAGTNFFDIEEYYIEFPDGHRIYVHGDELSRRVEKPQSAKGCECGAWVTSFPNHHADYCPKYRRYKC